MTGATWMSVLPDHPRSRGVYALGFLPARARYGSSPLARGLPCPTLNRRRPRRIIPARAGFTTMVSATRWPRRDHPRSRGVYRVVCDGRGGARGSSPLARGLPRRRWTRRPTCGIIPARAGFTRVGVLCHRRVADHPRSRGVYPTVAELNKGLHGSSPLARGLPEGFHGAAHGHGIIPARAGFTDPGPPVGRVGQDHPRSRGVYQLRCRRPPLRHGIIPARAGFTRPCHPHSGCPPDHPRSRGVYKLLPTRSPTTAGSSPLARGLPDLDTAGRVKVGIIPARAGFTDLNSFYINST